MNSFWRLPVIVLLANLALILVLLWSSNERTEVTVRVSHGWATAEIDGQAQPAHRLPLAGGRPGLYLEDHRSSRSYAAPVVSLTGLAAQIQALADIGQRTPFGPAWTDVRLDGQPVPAPALRSGAADRAGGDSWGEWRTGLLGETAPDRSGYLLLPAPAGESYVLQATLLRGAYPAGLLVGVSPSGRGEALLLRPDYRDMLWREWSGGELGADTSHSTVFSKSAMALVQDNLRLLLGAYPFLLALGLAGLALTLMLWLPAALLSRLRLPSREEDRVRQVSNPPYGDGPGTPEGRGEPCVRPAGAEAAHREDRVGRVSNPPYGDGPGTPEGRGEPRVHPTREGGSRASLRRLAAPLAAAALALVGLGLAAYIAFDVLEHIPHVQDSVTYLFQAKTLALGHLWVPSPPDLDAFQEEFMVNFRGRWFGKYPPGYPLVLSLGVLAGAPWLVNPLLFAATLFVLYLTGRELWGSRGTGLLAVLLGLTSPFLLFMSGEMMSHPLGLFLAALLPLGWARARRDSRWDLLAGAATGWLFLTRPYTALALGVPFGAWALLDVIRDRPDAIRRLCLLAAPAIVGVASYLAYNAALTGDPWRNPMELYWAFDKVGFGPGFGMSPEGHTPERGLWNTLVNLKEMQLQLFGWPGQLTLAVLLVPFLSGRATRWDWLLLAMAASLALAYVAWWAEGIMYGPRYYYEIAGVLILLTARGFIEGGRLLGSAVSVGANLVFALQGRGARRDNLAQVRKPAQGSPQGSGLAPAGAAAAYLLAALLVVYNAVGYLPVQFELHRGYNFISGEAIRLVESAGLRNAVVFVRTTQMYAWWTYGAVFSANSPHLDTPIVYAQDVGTDRNRAVMTHFPQYSAYLLEGSRLEPLTASPASEGNNGSRN